MKKIFRYLILFLVVYLVVELYVFLLTRTSYKDMNNYDILVTSPKIEITECKTSKSKGYIKGKATNDTGELINDLEIQFDFYNEQGKFIGSKSNKVEIFNSTEIINFDIKHEYKNVAEIKISVVKD